ncbi:hypothetical protein Pmani_008126 [Petrolisthes manimaculis]|uniref:Uncharacterized protein n=1 Tax=Petrolisthes manimaculis TaxID=1843537 RepID=A0AAE1UE49_9EUCA|nr:hypothetical protein Pmani_008126 [Petrolisthes manimaculis]
MARAGVLVLATLVTLFTLASILTTTDAFALCPTFPRCCRTRSCGLLCPSCSEASEFRNGKRIRPIPGRRRSDNRLLVPDPYVFVNADIFPSPFIGLI